MNLSKFREQDPEVVRKNQPELYDSIKKAIPSLDKKQFGQVAGLIIEYVIQSGGDVDIFQGDEIELEDPDYI